QALDRVSVTTSVYDAGNRMISRSYGDGYTFEDVQLTWTINNQVRTITDSEIGSLRLTRIYLYDGAGRIARIENNARNESQKTIYTMALNGVQVGTMDFAGGKWGTLQSTSLDSASRNVLSSGNQPTYDIDGNVLRNERDRTEVLNESGFYVTGDTRWSS